MSAAPPPEPTELIYLPRPSWAPLLIALGLALLGIGSFFGWFPALVGALAVLAGIVSWIRLVDDEVAHMRREQRSDTAVIPAVPTRIDE